MQIGRTLFITTLVALSACAAEEPNVEGSSEDELTSRAGPGPTAHVIWKTKLPGQSCNSHSHQLVADGNSLYVGYHSSIASLTPAGVVAFTISTAFKIDRMVVANASTLYVTGTIGLVERVFASVDLVARTVTVRHREALGTRRPFEHLRLEPDGRVSFGATADVGQTFNPLTAVVTPGARPDAIAIGNGDILATTTAHTLERRDAQGGVAWSAVNTLPLAIGSTNVVYARDVALRLPENELVGLNAGTGTVAWRSNTSVSQFRFDVATNRDAVFVHHAKRPGPPEAYDAILERRSPTGAVRFRVTFPSLFFRPNAPRPISAIATAANNMVYVSGESLLRAYGASGNLVWQLDDVPIETPSARPIEVDQLVIGANRVLYGVRAGRPNLTNNGCDQGEVMAVGE